MNAGLLQPGIHWAMWAEVEERFASTEWRRTLLDGVRRAAESLKEASCRTLYLDGSLVTSKNHPGDFDGYRTPAEVYQHGQEERGAAAEEAGLPSGLVKPSAGVGDSLNLALVLS